MPTTTADKSLGRHAEVARSCMGHVDRADQRREAGQLEGHRHRVWWCSTQEHRNDADLACRRGGCRVRQVSWAAVVFSSLSWAGLVSPLL